MSIKKATADQSVASFDLDTKAGGGDVIEVGCAVGLLELKQKSERCLMKIRRGVGCMPSLDVVCSTHNRSQCRLERFMFGG